MKWQKVKPMELSRELGTGKKIRLSDPIKKISCKLLNNCEGPYKVVGR